MKLFKPRYASDVAAELVSGLLDGSIVLDRSESVQVHEGLNRRSWIYLVAFAMLTTLLTLIFRIRIIADRITIDMALMVSAEASTVITTYLTQKPSEKDVTKLSNQIRVLSRLTGSGSQQREVIAAVVAAKAVEASARIPYTPDSDIKNVTLDLAGNAAGAIFVTRDTFISNVKLMSSVPKPDETGIWIQGSPVVVAYRVIIENLTQNIDGIFWYEPVFRNCKIISGGGTIRIYNGTFVKCRSDATVSRITKLKTFIESGSGSFHKE